MKRIFSALLAASLSTAAMADTAPLFNWSGFYGGLSGGWSSSSRKWDFPTNALINIDRTVSKSGIEAGIWGGHLGLQQQFGSWVFGVEANLGSINKMGRIACPNPAFACESKISSYWTVGPRLGYVWNNTLWYATGGYAQAGIETNLKSGSLRLSYASQRHYGWFIGGGVEYPISNNLLIGVEYQHQSYGNELYMTDNGITFNRNVKADVDLVRARLTWKFGPPFGQN